MEQIGEGGMGLVFVAEQQTPVRRRVAIKVIKPGMDTRDVIACFEGNGAAAALAADGSSPHRQGSRRWHSTTAGWPYFVMELVKGLPSSR